MSLDRHFSCSNVNLNMAPGGSTYRDQRVQSGSPSGSPNRHQSRAELHKREEEKQLGRGAQRADDFNFSAGKRRGSTVYDEYTGSIGAQGKDKETSFDNYDSWATGPQALKRFMSPYGDYDMDESSFFARTTRLSIVGPSPSSIRILSRRSSSTERLLINCGERSMVTAATSFQKTERSRSLSPPVSTLAVAKIASPTESYMKLSLQPSIPLTDPTASRKLLVLDLNGTLLLRSAHSSRRAPPPPPPPPPSYSRVRHSTPSSASYSYSALRTIYPRPYLPSFCAYLFHPTTLRWLDTMVWSSAQPHSVNDMVDKCFGTYKKELKAIWARDTLGLSGDEYHKKTQTTKDLAKPWAQIPSSLTSHLYHSQSSSRQPLSTSHSSKNHRDDHASLPRQQQHSALTTLLIDDSPLKAVLQPWNHICVSEYGIERQRLDVEIAERNSERAWLDKRERAKGIVAAVEEEEKRTRDGASSVDMTMKSNEENDEENKEAERKRRKREKKTTKKEKLLLEKQQQQQQLESEESRRVVEDESYDETLLAVIGILDRLKFEGNVAGWMRRGGLMDLAGDQATILESNAIDGMAKAENENAEAAKTTMTIPIPNPPTTTISPSSTKRDSSSMFIQGPSKRRRLTHVTNNNSLDTEMYPVSVASERVLELDDDDDDDDDDDSDSKMVVPPTIPTKATTKTLMSSLVSSSLPSSPLSSVQAEQTLGGLPLVSTSATPLPPTSGRENSLSTTQSQQQPLLWYETSSVLSHWAQHGRKALAELGIEIVSGVVPTN